MCGRYLHRKVTVAVGKVATTVGDGPMDRISRFVRGIEDRHDLPRSTRVPTLAADKVALSSGPADLVFTGIAVRVGHLTSSIGPKAVVEAVVGASATGSVRTFDEIGGGASWSSKDRRDSRCRQGNALEEEHSEV